MIALDTHLLARLLLRDDKKQHARALQLLTGQQEFTAAVSVMLELGGALEPAMTKRLMNSAASNAANPDVAHAFAAACTRPASISR